MLARYIWELKDEGYSNPQDHIKWSIHQKSVKYKCGTRMCSLCLEEKLAIANEDKKVLLNKRTELLASCPHRHKFLYSNLEND